VIVLKSM